MSGLMDVTVQSVSLGRARVRISLGHGHFLEVNAHYDTDRYTDVSMVWEVPAQVLTRDQVRDRQHVRLMKARLDQDEGKVIDR